MIEVSKEDWKLFRVKVAEWQENYMEKLNKEYVALLNGPGNASDKFWKLEKRIKSDKRSIGVQIELCKKEMADDIIFMLCEHIIVAEDLDGFSEELIQFVLERYEMYK